MGTGILASIKGLAPLGLYALGVALFFGALVGKGRWTLLLVALLLPLRNVVEKMHGFPLGEKYLTLLILAMAVGWIISSAGQGRKLMERSSLNTIAVFLIGYTFVSLLLGSNTLHVSLFDVADDRVQDWKNFCLMPILFFVTLNTIRDKKWVWRIFAVMCFSMFLKGYYTTSQVEIFPSLFSREKITGTFQFLGPNEVAAFFDQYSIVLLGVFYGMKKSWAKVFLLLLVCLNTYCMVFTYSRAAYLAFTVGLMILFLVRDKKMLIALALVLIFWQTVLPEKARERIESTKNEFGELDESAGRRLDIWSQSVSLFQENPITGIGFGVFRRLGYGLGDTHNIYLKLLVEQGVIGLFIFFCVLVAFMREGFRLCRHGTDDLSRGLGLGFLIAIVVLIVNNIFGDRWSYLELSAYLWIYAGLVARLNAIAREEPSQVTQVCPPGQAGHWTQVNRVKKGRSA